jgi:hypothetical protein
MRYQKSAKASEGACASAGASTSTITSSRTKMKYNLKISKVNLAKIEGRYMER